jgi:hypothetical protein
MTRNIHSTCTPRTHPLLNNDDNNDFSPSPTILAELDSSLDAFSLRVPIGTFRTGVWSFGFVLFYFIGRRRLAGVVDRV